MKLPHVVGGLSLSLGSIVVAGGLAEAAVRVYALAGGTLGREIATWDPLSIKVEPHGAFGYRQRPNAVFSYFNGTHATANAEGCAAQLR